MTPMTMEELASLHAHRDSQPHQHAHEESHGSSPIVVRGSGVTITGPVPHLSPGQESLEEHLPAHLPSDEDLRKSHERQLRISREHPLLNHDHDHAHDHHSQDHSHDHSHDHAHDHRNNKVVSSPARLAAPTSVPATPVKESGVTAQEAAAPSVSSPSKSSSSSVEDHKKKLAQLQQQLEALRGAKK